MAAGQLNLSRRDVLGAAAVLPLSSLPLDGGGQAGAASDAERGASEPAPGPTATPSPTLPHQGGGSRWARALARYRAAEGRLEEAGRRCSLRPGSGQASRAEIDAAEDEYGDRLEALYERLRRLLTVPAPGLGAFLVKVELMIEHEVATVCGGEPCLAAVREDARRLAAGLAAP